MKINQVRNKIFESTDQSALIIFTEMQLNQSTLCRKALIKGFKVYQMDRSRELSGNTEAEICCNPN